jgi:predicted ferric reductase
MQRRVATWVALYIALVALPLLVVWWPPRPAGRELLRELSVALGFVGLSLMAVQFGLVARLRRQLPPVASDTTWQFHRHMGIVALGVVLAHPLLLGIIDRETWAYLDPRVDWMRAGALWAATLSLCVVVGASLWRERLGLSYEWWRISHGALASVVVLVGLAHVTQVGHYVRTIWHQGFFGLLVLGALGFLGYVRVGKPWLMRRRPYRVVEVRAEPGDVWTLSLAPDGHEGLRFTAGQYAWITLGPTPFSLQQHPFSFSSSAEHPERLEFTVKELGNFTESLDPGTAGRRAFVEGPYGTFVFTEPATRGGVFVAGGIGVTPILSMLRTLADRGDPRHFVLVYGNATVDEIVFRAELERLQAELHLDVHHVVEEPPPDWDGQKGLISEDMLNELLPKDGRREYEYYICGPDPLIDVAEPALVRLGVPLDHLHSERFAIV